MPDVARTLDLPSGQRFEYWKHLLSHTFVPLEVSTPGGGADFQGRSRLSAADVVSGVSRRGISDLCEPAT